MSDGVEQTLIGTSAIVQSLMAVITQVAVSDATILITGESGVGKELVADIIHIWGSVGDSSIVRL